MVNAALLSINNLTAGIQTPRSLSNSRTPSMICQARVAALSSASAVDKVDTVCLEERQTMMEPPNDTIKPDCDLVSAPAYPASDHPIRSDKSPEQEIKIP
jgi:hypothetical protein